MKLSYLSALLGLYETGFVSGFNADSREIHDRIVNEGTLIGNLATDSTALFPLLSNYWAGTITDYLQNLKPTKPSDGIEFPLVQTYSWMSTDNPDLSWMYTTWGGSEDY